MQRRSCFALILQFAVASCLSAIALACAAQIDNPDRHAPGDAPPWNMLKHSYDVDSKKDPVAKEESRPNSKALTLHITLTGPSSEPVSGAFMRPKPEGTYPVVLLLHGLTSDKEAMLRVYGIPLIEHGFAVLALDAPHHGERKSPETTQTDTSIFGDTIHEGCREYRRAMDWLAARKDIDAHRIGLLGYNMGSIMGAIIAAVDDRVQDIVLCGGGDPIVSFAPNIPEGKRDAMYSISPSLFVGHIAPRRILMLNGRMDQVMLDTAVFRLYDSALKPKTLEWFDSGHVLPAQHVLRAVSWLVDQLNPAPH